MINRPAHLAMLCVERGQVQVGLMKDTCCAAGAAEGPPLCGRHARLCIQLHAPGGRPGTSRLHEGKLLCRYIAVNLSLSWTDAAAVSAYVAAIGSHSSCMGSRERETLHLFQPPRADQMPDPRWGRCHNIRLDNLLKLAICSYCLSFCVVAIMQQNLRLCGFDVPCHLLQDFQSRH